MATRIFYFSATGNSLQIARNIAKEMDNAVVLPIAGSEINEPVGGLGASVGFVFPVYFNGLPRLVKNFIENLDIAQLRNYKFRWYSVKFVGYSG
jgi:flavodoxin